MAKFNFRLQGFLGIKEKIEDQRKLEYSQALRRLEEEKQKKIRLLAQRDEQIMCFRISLQNVIKPPETRRYNDTIELLKYKITEQDKRINAAEIFAETKRVALIEAMKERKILESVKNRKHEEYVRAEILADQKRIDEIISYQYTGRDEN